MKPMTVGKLIEELQKLPKNTPLVYSIGDEDSDFHLMYTSPSVGLWEKGGLFVSNEQMKEEPEEYEYLKDNGIKVVCIN